VIRRAVARGAVIGAFGAAVGLLATGGLARMVQTLMFQVSATDWVSYSAAAGILIAIAALAPATCPTDGR
jgi:ABC-type antimicrobial peptide transport system permease subunit